MFFQGCAINIERPLGALLCCRLIDQIGMPVSLSMPVCPAKPVHAAPAFCRLLLASRANRASCG